MTLENAKIFYRLFTGFFAVKLEFGALRR